MKRYLFFRMPKTGSTFLTSLLREKIPDQVEIQGHASLYVNSTICVKGLDRPELWRFCFVRNPYLRFISAYRWIMAPNKKRNVYDEKCRAAIHKYKNLRELCLNLEEFTSDPNNSPIHFYPQYQWITDERNQLTMDYVGRFESMDESWKLITSKLGMDYTPIFGNSNRRSLKSKLRKTRNTIFDLFQPYEDVLPLIQTFYEKDFELFDYPARSPAKLTTSKQNFPRPS